MTWRTVEPGERVIYVAGHRAQRGLGFCRACEQERLLRRAAEQLEDARRNEERGRLSVAQRFRVSAGRCIEWADLDPGRLSNLTRAPDWMRQHVCWARATRSSIGSSTRREVEAAARAAVAGELFVTEHKT